MRWKSVVMLVLAVVFGGSAMLAGNAWLKRQARDAQPLAVVQPAAPPPPPAATVVVASAPLRYGDELGAGNLREVSWPADSVPAGAFKRVSELTEGGKPRVALAPMEPNEPILPPKITGPGQRGTLSALLEDGMGAVTIAVNEVIGVAGFVLPGDRVDVMLTRHNPGGEAIPDETSSYTDVVLQNVRVLAVDQLADAGSDKPSVVNAVTVEVGSVAAQKVALAAKAGSLSLMLRKAGEVAARPGRRVALNEIGQDEQAQGSPRTATVRVMRGVEGKDYAVPSRIAAPVNVDVAAAGRPQSRPAAQPATRIRRAEAGL